MFNSVGTFLTEKSLNKEFYIYECGYEDVKPREPYQYEPIDYYLIHYILKGQGHFFINDEHVILEENQGFIIPPNTKNNYYPLTEDPWSYRWIGFKGAACHEIFQECGLLLPTSEKNSSNYVYQFLDKYQMDSHFKNVFAFSEVNKPYSALGEAYHIVDLLSSQYHERIIHNLSEAEKYVEKAMNLIHQHYYNPDFNIENLSDAVQIERTYLFRLFKKYKQISPKTYLIEYRLNKSAELLRKTSYSIEEIAFLVGFNHPSHFSRQFAHYKKMSPSKFRAQFYSK
ncbi:AraC family transcriptional regulator [Carnobacterium sp.]|uniref:AraC family transcriptional regulator n=1 Tax=Carnobacterium sp. TaxID=48221 RepID=UPI0028AF2A58|nr:AraC family transcriptional regulator [Carnobacterium sp.]